jgi:HicA toxin of bacterial toxin-antitoxin,
MLSGRRGAAAVAKKRSRATGSRPPARGEGLEPTASQPGPAESPARALGAKHRATLEAIFATPVRSNIPWRDVEALLAALGGVLTGGSGSRVQCLLGDRVAVFHRPHPRKETDKGAVKSVRRYLTEAGVTP